MDDDNQIKNDNISDFPSFPCWISLESSSRDKILFFKSCAKLENFHLNLHFVSPLDVGWGPHLRNKISWFSLLLKCILEL